LGKKVLETPGAGRVTRAVREKLRQGDTTAITEETGGG